jgi:hypothetical protein
MNEAISIRVDLRKAADAVGDLFCALDLLANEPTEDRLRAIPLATVRAVEAVQAYLGRTTQRGRLRVEMELDGAVPVPLTREQIRKIKQARANIRRAERMRCEPTSSH